MRTLHHHTLSALSRKVRLLMHEKRLEFTEQVIEPWQPDSGLWSLNPAGELPVLVEDDGQAIVDHNAICEYLDEVEPTVGVFGKTPKERAEARRLAAWFDVKFSREVGDYIVGEKLFRRVTAKAAPDSRMLKAGRDNIHTHLQHIAWLTERRRWLAGEALSVADFAAAAQLSLVDYIGDVPWDDHPLAKEWYVRMKSRPSFRCLLKDTIQGVAPAPIYTNLDF